MNSALSPFGFVKKSVPPSKSVATRARSKLRTKSFSGCCVLLPVILRKKTEVRPSIKTPDQIEGPERSARPAKTPAGMARPFRHIPQAEIRNTTARIIPLLTLAARELSHSFDIYPEERVEISVVAGGIMILLMYIGFTVSNIGLNPYSELGSTTMPISGRLLDLPIGPRYVILIGAMLILVVCINLVAFGWSLRTARLGTVWSFSLFLGIYTLAATWGTSGQRTPNGIELWLPDQPPVQADLLMKSVNDISLFSRGQIESQPVTVMGIDSPALEWALRNHDVTIVNVLDPLNAPPIIITPLMNELGLPSAYRGQDFTWRQPPVWDAVQAPDWIKWLVYRQLPGETETIILWARDDLFPDARENTQP